MGQATHSKRPSIVAAGVLFRVAGSLGDRLGTGGRNGVGNRQQHRRAFGVVDIARGVNLRIAGRRDGNDGHTERESTESGEQASHGKFLVAESFEIEAGWPHTPLFPTVTGTRHEKRDYFEYF